MKLNARREKNLEKYISVVIGLVVFLTLYFFMTDARGAEPREIFARVINVDTGICDMDANGTVSSSTEKTAYSRKCDIGINPYEPMKRYISTFGDDGKRESVIEADTVTGTQTIIWHKGRKKI